MVFGDEQRFLQGLHPLLHLGSLLDVVQSLQPQAGAVGDALQEIQSSVNQRDLTHIPFAFVEETNYSLI